MADILITGVTGLIGKETVLKLNQLTKNNSITALVRTGTSPDRLKPVVDYVDIVYLDINQTQELKQFLQLKRYDTVLHIGALRGGRKASKQQYYNTNVASTEQFIEYCVKNKSRLIFCSSVGVFGAIPEEMPANNSTPYKEDNYYHYTKIASEKLINRAILNGLNAVIVRPSITYGTGDIGFPTQLVKLIKNRLFVVSNKNIWMHLCNIDTISTALAKLATDKIDVSGVSFNIADIEPVRLQDLVNFIYRQIYNKNYPALLKIDNSVLRTGEAVARFMKNELWTARFELISHSWFYQVQDAYERLDLPQHYTIPDFRIAINDYLKKKQ